jgi:hypothetical protein
MRRLLTCLAVAAALGFPSSSAFAGSQVFTSTLTPESGVTTSGTATGVLLLNNTTDQVGGVVSYQDLTGTPTAVHLHGPGPGGEVTFEFTGIPSGATGLVASAFQLTTAQVADLQAGRDSFEIHTPSFPDGELSGTLTSSAVPEPSSVVLIGTGALFLVGYGCHCRARKTATARTT